MEIGVDDLSGSEIAEFLDDHVQEMKRVSAPESKHALDLDGLRRPDVTFWSVMDGETLVGCGAIKALDAEHAEVKSMRTAPSDRRRGVASMLLRHIVSEARRMGFKRLSLETGATDFFEPARQLYLKHGFATPSPSPPTTRTPTAST